MRKLLLAATALLFPLAAHAQSVPQPMYDGQVINQAVVSAWMQTKQDVLGFTPANPTQSYNWPASQTFSGAGTSVFVTNGLTVAGTSTLTGLLTGTTVNSDAAAQAGGYQTDRTMRFTLPSNASGIYFGDYYRTIVAGSGAGTSQVWSHMFQTYQQGTSALTSPVVNLYSQSVRQPSNPTPNNVLWSGIFEVRDQTNLPSAQGGRMLGIELDVAGNDLDNFGSPAANQPHLGRQGLVIALLKDTAGGANPEASCMVCGFGNGYNGDWETGVFLQARFRFAAIDLHTALPITGNTGGTGVWFHDSMQLLLDTAGLYGFRFLTSSNAFEFTNNLTGVFSVANDGNRISFKLSTPASSSDTCVAGDEKHDANYIYICTATNTFKRATLSTF
jgi:hypothetical protein